MNDPKPQYWFPAKRYGWGWGPPTTWQGWVIMIGWIVLLLVIAPIVVTKGWVWFAVFMWAMVSALIAICVIKGEPPRWRWGEKQARGTEREDSERVR